MLLRRFALLGFVAAFAGIGACAPPAEEDDIETAGAAVSQSDQCLVQRYTAENGAAPSAFFSGNEVLARAGQRVSVAAVDSKGDVGFEVLIVGADQRAPATSASGDVKLAEIVSSVDARYHFEIRDASGRARTFRATIDVILDRPDCVNGRRLCYRAIGSQCKGIPVLAPAKYLADGRRTLSISAGSQLHDTCCLAHSDGQFCGGNEGRDLNPLSGDIVCGPEWNRAWYDTKNLASWAQVFDPTQFEYAVSPVARTTGSYAYLTWAIATGEPTKASALPASGSWTDKSDASRWCSRGVGGAAFSLSSTRCR
jgi:hypothetical protein